MMLAFYGRSEFIFQFRFFDATMSVNKFRINIYQRIMLVFQPMFLLAMLAINLWTSFHLRNMSNWERILFPAVIIALTVWAIAHLFRWFTFAVELSDHGINISGAQLRWEELESANARLDTHFSSYSTLIELKSRDRQLFKIPACIQRNALLLREIQSHIPDAVRE